MTRIKLIVNGSKVRAEVDGILTSGSVGIPVTIDYDSSWDGLTKHLVCTSGKWGPTGNPRTMLNVDTASTVPHEVMIAKEHLYIGIEGRRTNGSQVIRTVLVDCGMIFPGADANADASVEPTQPVWAQLQAQIDDLKKSGSESTEDAGSGSSHPTELTAKQIDALHNLLKVSAYIKSDISEEYAAFLAAFGLSDSNNSGEDEGTDNGDEPEIYYAVNNHLTNVTTDNPATTVPKGGTYSANLTVEDGYALENLVITHNGEDVTDSVYGEGYILITNVSGDIVITAIAAVPEYVDIATGISTNSVNIYSDAGVTNTTTKYYQTGAYSLNRTETDATVKVILTNNTESDISSSNVYIGSADAQAIRNPNSTINLHHAISGSKGTVAAGASVEIEYTVRAGYWFYVMGYDSLSVSVVGKLDVHEVVDTLAVTSKQIDVFTAYSDDGTTQTASAAYRTAYATEEAFDVDTEIMFTVVSGGANGGNILYGCVESGTLTANVSAYYGGELVVKAFAVGAVLPTTYTVKAGYHFAILPCSGATIYIEKV